MDLEIVLSMLLLTVFYAGAALADLHSRLGSLVRRNRAAERQPAPDGSTRAEAREEAWSSSVRY